MLLATERGLVLTPTGSYDLAAEVMTAALPDAMEIGGAAAAQLLLDLCRVESALNQTEAALEHGARAIELFEELDDRSGLAMALRVYGGTVSDADERPAARRQAIPILERAARLAREVGNAEEEAAAHLNLGWSMKGLGETEAALQNLRVAIARFEHLGIKAGIANGYLNLSDVLIDAERFDEAREAATAALAVAQEIGHRVWEAGALAGFGQIFQQEGDHEQAVAYLDRSRTIFAELGDVGHLTWVEPILAEAVAARDAAAVGGQ